MRTHSTLFDRWNAKIDRTGECWLWTGSRHRKGYGHITAAGTLRQAHRLAWEFASGEPVPPGKIVCHVCDETPCVRNDEPGLYVVRGITYPRFGHLFLADNSANVSDAYDKGRQQSRLAERDVRAIRERLAGGERQIDLCREYSVSPGAIAAIAHHRSWKHVP